MYTFSDAHISNLFLCIEAQILISTLSSSSLKIHDKHEPKDLPPQCLVQTEAHCNGAGAGS